jgi:hypothetical protein
MRKSVTVRYKRFIYLINLLYPVYLTWYLTSKYERHVCNRSTILVFKVTAIVQAAGTVNSPQPLLPLSWFICSYRMFLTKDTFLCKKTFSKLRNVSTDYQCRRVRSLLFPFLGNHKTCRKCVFGTKCIFHFSSQVSFETLFPASLFSGIPS